MIIAPDESDGEADVTADDDSADDNSESSERHATMQLYVADMVGPGTPPLGHPPGLTVSPRVGTVHAGVSRPRVGREAPG